MMMYSSRKAILVVTALVMLLPACVDGRLEGILDGTFIQRLMDFLRGRKGNSRDDNVDDVGKPIQCNKVTCSTGEYCCNESCSTCAKEGDSCTLQFCSDPDESTMEEPATIPCNKVTCSAGEFCCNESCSTCAKEGDSCTEQFCFDDPSDEPIYEDDATGDDGMSVECDVDSDCPTRYCFTLPCPQATCVKNKCTYGDGLETLVPGTRCGPNVCVGDDVCCNDICGVCIAPGDECPMVKCRNPDEGIACGTATCDDGEFCCNESCGICAAEGEGCNKMLCVGDGDTTTPESP